MRKIILGVTAGVAVIFVFENPTSKVDRVFCGLQKVLA